MNPQYMNQQPPGGMNPGYRMPPASQAPQGYGAPPPGPPNPYGGPPQNVGGPPQNMGGPPPNMGGPPPNMGGPPQNIMGAPPPSSTGAPYQNHMGGPPPNSMTGPPNMLNGPSQRPAGPPGTFGKAGGQQPVGSPGPYSMSNGPPSGPPGTQGGAIGHSAMAPPTQPGYRGPNPPSSQPMPPRPPSAQQQQQHQAPGMPPGSQSQMPPSTNQISNQMGAMNLGPGSRPPSSMAPPSSSNLPTSGYSNQMPGPGGFPQQGPPPSQGQSVRPGFPQRMAGPPPMTGPTMSHAGAPPPMPGVPNSQQPPSSMAGPPPPMTGPASGPMGYQQGPAGAGMLPPGSMAGPMPDGQFGAPPPVPGGMPPPPSPGGGFQGGQPQGYPGMPGTAPAMSAPTQPQQPRRLDPDQMPSPIQVIEDDRLNRTGPYVTGQRGSVPPLVTTKFTVEDRGNSNPRLIRSSMYNIPCTNDMMKQSQIPFVMSMTPFARLEENEAPLPVVDLGAVGPVRCNRCKAYMNPYMQFVDGGRRFQCCFCSCNTDVPPEYFAHLDHTGRRVDCFDRPELCLGSYEFVATTDYCKNNKLPSPPAYIFMIDVSYNSVKSGLLNLLCQHLKEDILVNLPKEVGMDESEIRVGFVTYAKELQFYNVKGNLAQPQMLVVSDVQDVFVPLLDGFLVKLSESEGVIDSLLSQIPQTFAESRETEIVLGPVIEAGLDALKSADIAGKLIIFHTSLPIAEAPGKLKNRDDRKLLGTDKEKVILAPQSNYYTKLGQDCVAAGCGVDLFLFPNSYIDIASIAEVPRLTGGNIFKYSYFQADLDGPRLIEDLKSNVMRPIAFDCIMRVRTSTGIRPTDFLGNFYMANTTDVELANMDCDKTVTVEIKHDDKLSDSDGAVVQAAILYTSIAGQRRLRIINMSLNCCTQMADLFRNCELDILINYMAKVAIRESLNSNPKTVRENIMNRCAQILGCYRKNCASPSSAGQLILPECMKLLPLYSNCIVKNPVLQGASEVSTDDRSYLIHLVNAMSVKDSHVFFYPRLIPLHDLPVDTEDPVLPQAIRCSYERLKDNGIYLIENGLAMFMWIGLNVPTEWVVGLFGVQSAAQIDIDQTRLQELDTPRSRQVRAIVRQIRQERLRHLKLVIVRQRDKLEPVFQQHLVEDRSAGGGASYVDFLCHIHKEIRTLLS